MSNEEMPGPSPTYSPTSPTAIVIDTGMHSIKAGFAGEHHPKVETRTLIGRPRHQVYLMLFRLYKNFLCTTVQEFCFALSAEQVGHFTWELYPRACLYWNQCLICD